MNISASLLSGIPITLLDSDLSETEIQNLCGKRDLYAPKHIRIPEFHSFGEFLNAIKSGENTWICTLFSSGTTGRPKRIDHSLKSLARHVKISPKHSGDIWGFAYNPTHIAGLQVFFQAVFNANTIVRLFGLSANSLLKTIEGESVTHISATPTFFRMLPDSTNAIPQVRAITSGGENSTRMR